jgi:FKBP-type peptidyl-prolyl cis-trans isomerase
MKRSSSVIGFLLAALALAFAGCGKEPAKTTTATKPPAAGSAAGIQSVDQKVSYGVGYNMGRSLGREKTLQLDRTAFQAGLDDGLAGSATRVPDTELEAAFAIMQQKSVAANAAVADKNLAACNDYLAKNKTKTGVKTTASGLQYEVIRKGSGPHPKTTDKVKVHYHGTLTDGTVFDSSVQRGEPVEFAVTGVIAGWTEALQLMSVGDKWKITIPPGLAYGPQARGKIPANAVLIFELELLGIK